jgi:hypothetical protein
VIFLDFSWNWFFQLDWIGWFFVGLDWLVFYLDWIGWFFIWIGLVWFFVGLDWLVFSVGLDWLVFLGNDYLWFQCIDIV